MSRISELITRLCPDGVEYKRLGEVCEYVRGVTYNKAQEAKTQDEPSWKILRANNIDVHSNTLFLEDVKLVSTEVRIKPTQWLKKGDILICAGSGSKEHVGKVAYIFEDMDYSFGGFMAVVRCSAPLNSRFLFHILTGEAFHSYLGYALNSTTINNLSAGVINPFKFPLPPLAIQEEIVRILDTLTELEAELEARKKQYAHYRDTLLTFSPDDPAVTWTTLGEVGTFKRGRRFVRTDIIDVDVPCIHYGDMYTYYGLKATKTKGYISEELGRKMRYAQKNDVVIVGAGENNIDIGVGLAWLGDEKAAVHDACYIYRSGLDPIYLSHYLRSTDYHKQIIKYVYEGKICSISADNLAKAVIAVPPLATQRRIADVLDKFEALTTDLTSGLPAEIEARRKQYEYYRDTLLTFKKKN